MLVVEQNTNRKGTVMDKINVGTNDDGTPRHHYQGEHVVYVGRAINGTVLVGGSEVSLADDFVEADSPEHAEEIAHAVAELLVAEGHPTDPGFTYDAPEGK